MKTYPDVTILLRQKAQRRKRLARLSFEEKIVIVNKWRKLTQTIRKNRFAAKAYLASVSVTRPGNRKES
ncbi:MAG TPA: hypothetical protein VIF64_04695 [Pyrinomonadaceae bacterium]